MKKIGRALISALLAMLLCTETTQINGMMGNQGSTAVLGADDLLLAQSVQINGRSVPHSTLPLSVSAARNNLLGLLKPDTIIQESLLLGRSNILIDDAFFLTKDASISGSTVIINQPLVASEDIIISASEVILSEGAFLLSKNGSVRIYCSHLVVNGAIGAEDSVMIGANDVQLNELVAARKIDIFAADYHSDGVVSELVRLGCRNRASSLSIYEESGKHLLYCQTNFDYVSADIYGRKAGEEFFSIIKENVENTIEIPSAWKEYTDFAAVLVNSFGYTLKTDPVSVTVQEGTWITTFGDDKDGDGVSDAFEIWLSETNPNISSSFPDPDYYLFIEDENGCSCYDRLLRRNVSYKTDNYEKIYYYEDPTSIGRVTKTEIVFSDGTRKEIRYEHEDSCLKNLIVGENKYTVKQDESGVSYYVNDICVKRVISSCNREEIDYFDSDKELYSYDSNDNLILYQNKNKFSLLYDESDLLCELRMDEKESAIFSYDEYGNYLTIDGSDYSLRYTYDYPLYRVDYEYAQKKENSKAHSVLCKDDSYEHGDIVVLTDGSDGSSIPKEVVGEVLSYDPLGKSLDYCIGDDTHKVLFDARGYVISDVLESVDKETGDKIFTESIYSYDTYGNLLQVITKSNGNEIIHNYLYGDKWTDELTSFDGKDITYDTLGKPTKYYNGMSFVWSAGKLSEISDSCMHVSFGYDYHGLRISKVKNGTETRYVYEGRDLIAELSDDPIYYTYDGDFELVGFEWHENAYYYQYDIFGDVIAIVDRTGKVVCTYNYDLWGNIIEISGDLTVAKRNPIRYRGYYYDDESGLYYLETRYYDPVIKRFISFDDLESFFYRDEEDTESLFVYSGNDPVRYYDPEGRLPYLLYVSSISTPEFSEESRSFGSGVGSRLLHYSIPVIWEYTEYVSSEVFINQWNSFIDNRPTVIIINTHGRHDAISNGNAESRFYYSDFRRLKTIEGIKLVILLGCNCGHYDYYGSNMAYGFMKKTHGCVVASDGTVYSDILFNGFASINDKSFRNQRITSSNRDNVGWIVWSGRPAAYRTFFLGWTGWFNRLTAYKIVDYLVNNNFLE